MTPYDQTNRSKISPNPQVHRPRYSTEPPVGVLLAIQEFPINSKMRRFRDKRETQSSRGKVLPVSPGNQLTSFRRLRDIQFRPSVVPARHQLISDTDVRALDPCVHSYDSFLYKKRSVLREDRPRVCEGVQQPTFILTEDAIERFIR